MFAHSVQYHNSAETLISIEPVFVIWMLERGITDLTKTFSANTGVKVSARIL